MYGPSWLILPKCDWPKSVMGKLGVTPELKKNTCFIVAPTNGDINAGGTLLKKFSNYMRMLRICSFIFRFLKKVNFQGIISVGDLLSTESRIIKCVQAREFKDENKVLNEPVKKDNLVAFSPFLDARNVIRVGRRLKDSNIPSNRISNIPSIS